MSEMNRAEDSRGPAEPPAGVPGWEEPSASPGAVPHLRLKATLLLVFMLALVTGAALYVLYARGVFEPKQSLVLVTDNAEGVSPGMDLLFAGFAIGRVRQVALGEGGDVRITVDVNRKDARWLRTTSVYTLVRGLVGGAQLRAYTGLMADPPLPDGAERPVLRGDTNAEIQRLIGTARDLLENLGEMSSEQSDLRAMLAHLRVFTERLQGRQGALHALLGNERDARRLVTALERADGVLARADATLARIGEMTAHADQQLFGSTGLAPDARAALKDAQGLLAALQQAMGDARGSLRRVDAVLQQAQGIAENVKTGTQDLGGLRTEVESSLRRIEGLIDDIQRRWPFGAPRPVELP